LKIKEATKIERVTFEYIFQTSANRSIYCNYHSNSLRYNHLIFLYNIGRTDDLLFMRLFFLCRFGHWMKVDQCIKWLFLQCEITLIIIRRKS